MLTKAENASGMQVDPLSITTCANSSEPVHQGKLALKQKKGPFTSEYRIDALNVLETCRIIN